MREILFRGKTLTDKWVKGAYYKQEEFYGDKENADIIITSKETLDNDFALEFAVVIPETIEQFTGLTDKNGTKIFEGDILNCYSANGINDFRNRVVEWSELFLCFKAGTSPLYGDKLQDYEIIGNIHDNPELLKECEGKCQR